MDQGLADEQPPAHAAREVARVDISFISQAHRLDDFISTALTLGYAVVTGMHIQRLTDGEEGVEH